MFCGVRHLPNLFQFSVGYQCLNHVVTIYFALVISPHDLLVAPVFLSFVPNLQSSQFVWNFWWCNSAGEIFTESYLNFFAVTALFSKHIEADLYFKFPFYFIWHWCYLKLSKVIKNRSMNCSLCQCCGLTDSVPQSSKLIYVLWMLLFLESSKSSIHRHSECLFVWVICGFLFSRP